MTPTIQAISPMRKTYCFALHPELLREEEADLIQKWGRSVRIPGFRPGKAPKERVRQRYARELAVELERRMISKAYEKIRTDETIEVFSIVDVKSEGQWQSPASVTLTLTVDLQPSFELPEYQGITVEVAPYEIKETDIDRAIEQMRNGQAHYNVVNRAAQKGDYVKVSYEGKIDDQPIAELVPEHPIYGRQNMTWEEAGAAAQTPGVRAVIDGVIGMKAGEHKTVSMTFPETFFVEALDGKTAAYTIEVTEVREKVLPAIDDAFLKNWEVEDVSQLRSRVRERLEQIEKDQQRIGKRTQVIRALLERTDFPLPESGVEQEQQRLLRERLEKKGAKENLEGDETEAIRHAAQRHVKLRLILKKIAKAEAIELEEKETQQALLNHALGARIPIKTLMAELRKDRSLLISIQQAALLEKTLQFIIGKTAVKEVSKESKKA